MDDLKYTKVLEIAEKIRTLEIQGAVGIAIAAETALEDLLTYSKAKSRENLIIELTQAGKILKETRPSAVALPNAVDKFIETVESLNGDPPELNKKALKVGKELIEKLKNSSEEIAKHGATLIKDGQTILVHCHSSTVDKLLIRAWHSGKRFSVICTETRPWHQGFLTAKELSEVGIPTTLIVDSAAMLHMPHVDLVLIGADTITSDNKLINKIGTSQVALVAKHFQVPMYVATQSIKFTKKTSKQIKLEERDPAELHEDHDIGTATVSNIVFDFTDMSYIRGIITEEGLK